MKSFDSNNSNFKIKETHQMFPMFRLKREKRKEVKRTKLDQIQHQDKTSSQKVRHHYPKNRYFKLFGKYI